MKTLDELKSFCEGYRNSYMFELPPVDEWVTWGGYDINFIGSDFAEQATDIQLFCVAYLDGWTDCLGEPVHWFIV